MSKTLRNTIVIVAVILFIAGAIAYSIHKGKAAAVPAGVVGNTAGNLNNYGWYCEQDGVVYFSNAYDNGALYSMTPSRQDLKKIIDLDVEYINAGGDYVFFYGVPSNTTSGIGSVVSKPGMYMIKKNGKDLKALTKDISRSMILYGNKIYYQHYTEKTGTTFAVMDVSKHESEELLPYMINPACLWGNNIYYNGMYDNHFLYAYNLDTNTENLLWEGDIWNPIFDGTYVYYMDVLNDYRLCRYSISNNTIEILSKERTDLFNVYGNFIFYQTSGQNPALKRMNTDGTGVVTIAEGVYNHIGATSTYVYFSTFGSDVPVYCTPTYGDPYVIEFTEARDAVLNGKDSK
ncbi:MAG: DUF5050 domain-containing protein [Lachnospiraceae bacterium]|nr:DUF5050 domain-containing protein [Lachnospiraceae bacterium]